MHTTTVVRPPYVQTYQFVSTSSAQQLTGRGDDGHEHDCGDFVVVDANDDDGEDDGLMIHKPHHHVCIMLSAWAHRGDEAGVCCI